MTVVLGIVFAVFLVIATISVFSQRQWKRRVQGYSGVPPEDFVEHFSAQGVPSSLVRMVYDTFKQKVEFKEFMPSPEMRIEEVFDQVDEDTYDDALHILKALGIPKPSDEILARWDGLSVKTVSDLVLWIDWVRRQQ
jgi:hypothetical protein